MNTDMGVGGSVLTNSGEDWQAELSGYDTEILQYQKIITTLEETLNSIKDNQTLSNVIQQKITEYTNHIRDVQLKKKTLFEKLIRKQVQVVYAIQTAQVKKQKKEGLANNLQGEINKLLGTGSALQNKHGQLTDHLDLQKKIQTQIKEVTADKERKEHVLQKNQTAINRLDKVGGKLQQLGLMDLLTKNFVLPTYTLKKLNEYGYHFVDPTGKEILKIEELGLNISRRGNYYIKELDEQNLAIVSNEHYYVYNKKQMAILGYTRNAVHLLEYAGKTYLALKEPTASETDDQYYLFDTTTGKKLFDKSVTGNVWSIRKIGDEDCIYTRAYRKNQTTIHFYSLSNGDVLGSDTGYVGDKIIFDNDSLGENPISDTDKRDFVYKMLGMENVFFIDTGYGGKYITIVDNQFNKIGDFYAGSFASMTDGSLVAFKSLAGDKFALFDITHQKSLDENYYTITHGIRNFDTYCVCKKNDGHHVVVHKETKKVVDCMGNVGASVAHTPFLVIQSENRDNKNIQQLLNLDTGQMLSPSDSFKGTIQHVRTFYSQSEATPTAIVTLQKNTGDVVYAYVNLFTDVDSQGKLDITKTYDYLETQGHDSLLYTKRYGIKIAKITINGYGKRAK